MATPPLADPNFDRTVVLLLEHGDGGALGLVLNRPSPAALEDVLPEWRPVASPPAVVFVGGPVSPDAVIALARGTGAETAGWVEVLDGLGTVDVGRDPDDIGVRIEAVRVFAGYAGWAPGQLEREIEQAGWFVVDACVDDVFSRHPHELWRHVLRRQRGRLAMFATCPPDPTTN